MSLEFVIIPLTQEHEINAYDIIKKIKQTYKNHIEIEIDNNYKSSLNSRIVNNKRNEKDIITVDHDYLETNSFVIRFSEKGSRPISMHIDDFIELISSLDDNDSTKINENICNDEDEECKKDNNNEKENTCTFM
jgi:hypothetical protein